MSQADSTTSSTTLVFTEGDDVLHSTPDGFHFYGVVVDVEPESALCLIRFGDCTETWSHFADVKKLGVSLDSSGNSEVLDARSPQPLKFLRTILPSDGSVPDYVLRAREDLPYIFESLLWDESHQRNDKERYCYCGELGEWYKKMLQCNKCLQWFHQECIRAPQFNELLLGDRFFDFVCSLCTGSCEGKLERIDLKLKEALELVIFNLTVMNSKKFHSLEYSILPFFKKKWKLLQGPNSLLKLSSLTPQYISNVLSSNPSKFKCGSGSKKMSTFWGLRKVYPPVPPPRGKITHKLLNGTSSTWLQQKETFLRGNPNRKVPNRPQPQSKNNSQGSVRKSASGFFTQRDQLNQETEKRNKYPRSSTSSDSNGKSVSKKSKMKDYFLENLIPKPENYLGANNPFADKANQMMATKRRPSKRPRKYPKGTVICQKVKVLEPSSLFSLLDKGLANVLCKRKTRDGKFQVLVEWDDHFK